MPRILIVEDEAIIRSALKRLLERHDYTVSEAGSAEEASQLELTGFDLIISDLRLPGEPGTTLITTAAPVPVLIMTSYASMRSAVEALKQGAVDYVAKPFDHAELLETVERILHKQSMQQSPPPDITDAGGSRQTMIGNCVAMQQVYTRISKTAPADVTVLILGESGTGKELVAQALHNHSPRAYNPFIALNMAAIPKDLIESELFGHEKGAFTGAGATRQGRFEQANGGTLFLDEIGDMPLTLQTRLLRVLAEGEVLPLGSERPISVDCRVIAATHRDPARLIADGYFREDLYYRLNGATLRLPALRERADKQHVIISVMGQLARAVGQPRLQLRADAMSALLACPWPGNIRQLVNALNFAEATCDGEQITVNDLPEECLAQVIGPGTTPATTEDDDDGDPQRAGLLSILKRHHWMISAVARELGVSRPTVYRRMRKHGLTPPNQRDG